MWVGLKRTLIYVVLTLALFACVWTSRVFVSTAVFEQLMPVASILRIALIAVFSGLLPALVFGITYGLLAPPPVAWKALWLALGACVLELLIGSLTLPLWTVFPWWFLRTWWVLPLECLTLVLVFPAAAWAAARWRRAEAASA